MYMNWYLRPDDKSAELMQVKCTEEGQHKWMIASQIEHKKEMKKLTLKYI